MAFSNFKLAKSLGWASFAIGAVEIFAKEWLEKTMGVSHHHTLLPALGAREFLAGATILAADKPGPLLSTGLWSRVAGDVMDLALLGAAWKHTDNPQGLAGITAAVLGATAADVYCAMQMQGEGTGTMASDVQDVMDRGGSVVSRARQAVGV